MLESALAYAANGWPVFPVHGVTDKLKCTCGNAVCDTPGKHPIPRNGLKSATTDAGQIADWFRTYPWANVAICTGASANVFVLDVDPRHEGHLALRELEAQLGDTPVTLTADTGGGGVHLFFVAPRGTPIGNSAGRVGRGLDVRGDGGYVVAPPSRHVSGQTYEWREPIEEVAEAPEWLLERVRRKRAAGTSTKTQRYTKGGRNDALTSLAGTMRSRGMSHAAILAGLVADNRERCEPPLPDEEIERIAKSVANYVPTPRGVLLEALEQDEAWMTLLSTTKSGETKRTLRNVWLILENHSAWQGVFGFDERKQQHVFLKPPPYARPDRGPQIIEEDFVGPAVWIESKYGMTPSLGMCASVMLSLATQNSYDPAVDYLAMLSWDGVPRIDAWLSTYCGAKDTQYTRGVGAKWLISAVARAGVPGCKADYVLVLEGKQGSRKSSAFAILGGAWFSDDVFDLGSKNAAEQLQGPWIIELSELAAIRRADLETIKRFITRQVDNYRGAYERKVQARPRRCVFGGSTNEGAYLVDPTGDRRFWPVATEKVDEEALARDRDQLWAEAAARWAAGEKWWFEKGQEELDDAARGEQEARTAIDSWKEAATSYLRDRTVTTSRQLLSEVFNIEIRDYPKYDRKIGEIVHRLGWRKKVRTSPAQTQMTVYMHPDAVDNPVKWAELKFLSAVFRVPGTK